MDVNGKIGSCITNQEGIFIKIDQNCANILGYKSSELIGSSFTKVIFDEDLGLMKDLHDKYLTEDVDPSVRRYKKKDGSPIYAQTSGIGFEDKDGSLFKMTTIKDMTKIMQNEEEILEAAYSLQEAEKVGKIGHWTFDIETQQTTWSDSLYDIHEREPALGPPSFEVISGSMFGEDQDIMNIANQRAIDLSEPYELDLELITDKGSKKYLHVIGKPIGTKGSRATKMYGFTQDITERKNLEMELIESQRQYKTALTGAELGFWKLNLKTGEIFVNDYWLSMLGYEEHSMEVTFDFFNSIIHPADSSLPHKEIERINAGGKNEIDIIIRLKHKNGKYRTIKDRGKVIEWDDDGNALKLIGTHLDITEEVQAKQKLGKAEKEIDIALEGGRVGLYEFDLENESVQVNEYYMSMLGFDLNEVQKEYANIWEFISGLITDESLETVARERAKIVALESSSFDVELKIKNSNHLYQIIRSQGKVIEWDKDGNPTKVAGSHIDITQQKSIEGELIDSEYRYRFLAQSLPHILWTANPDGGINFINQYGMDYLGADQISVQGWNWLDYIHPEHQKIVTDKFQQCIEQKIAYDNIQLLKNSDGNYEWFRVTATPQLDLAGHIKLWIGLSTNIHNEILAENKAKEQHKLLTEVTANFPHTYLSVIDSDMKVKFSGGAEFQAMGLNPDSFNGVAVEEVYRPYDQPEITETILNSYRETFKGEPQKFEIHVGDQIQLYKTQPLRNFKGEVDSILAVVENVTEQRKNLERLELTIKKLLEIQKLSKVGDYYFDVETMTPIEWSPMMYEIYERDPAKGMFTPEEINNVNYGVDTERHNAHLEKAINESIPCELDLELITEKNNKKYAHISIIPDGEEGKKAKTLRGVIQDITHLKEAESERMKQQDLVRTIVENVPNAYVTVFDKDLVITYTGGQEFENQGFDSSSYIGMTLDEAMAEFPKFIRDPLRELYEQTLEGNPGSVQLKVDESYLEYKTAPLRNSDGEIDSLLVITENITRAITDKKMIEANLHEKELLLQEIHHRVKNNLAVIASLFYLEQMNSENEEVRKILMDSQARIKSIAEVHELLYKNENFSTITLKDYIDDIVEYLLKNFNFEKKNIQLDLDIETILLQLDKAIPVALLVNELLINVFKHAFKGKHSGKVLIKGSADNGMIQISVKDNGVGLPQDLDLENPKSLGLELIGEFVDQLHGKAEWKSQNGDGTEFLFRFNHQQ